MGPEINFFSLIVLKPIFGRLNCLFGLWTIPTKHKVCMEFNYMTFGSVWGDKDYIVCYAYT